MARRGADEARERRDRGRAECGHASRQLAGTPSCLEVIRSLESRGDGGAAIRARTVACHRCAAFLELRARRKTKETT